MSLICPTFCNYPKSEDMLPAPIPFTHDLRSNAIDRKRDVEYKSKWSPKWAVGYVTPVKLGPNDTQRPKRRCSQRCKTSDRNAQEKKIRRSRLARKQDVLGGMDSQEDSSTDDMTSHASTPRFEDNVAYSFDAEKGPSQGSEILGIALTKAVKKFEDHRITKLIFDEYDVLDNISDAGECGSKHEDDGFELI